MTRELREISKIEIFTLQDNYIDLAIGDDSDMVQRAKPLRGREMRNSVLAEHGFSALVTVTVGGAPRSILFDFGFSEHGALMNTRALNIDLSGVEALVLSHGHMDHTGGFHLTGPAFATAIEPTTQALKTLAPTHVVPCHTTGRKAVMHMEQEMPDQFILNMAGTRLTFA